MESRDIYIKLTDPTGAQAVVNAHRVWDGARFIDSQHKQYERDAKPEDRESSPRRRGPSIRPDADQTTTTEEIMKPIHDNLKAVRIEDDETGTCSPASRLRRTKFSNLVKAVVDTNKGGTITPRSRFARRPPEPSAVKPEVRVTLPKGAPAEALLWPTPDGNLVAEDPGKTSLNCGRFKTRRANSNHHCVRISQYGKHN